MALVLAVEDISKIMPSNRGDENVKKSVVFIGEVYRTDLE
jgi:hypothetical protein